MVFSVWKSHPRQLTVLTLAFGLMAVVGCSGNTSVKGTIKVGDTPLKSGSVRFVPDKDKGNTSTEEPTGTITDGTFTLMTNNKSGAPAGWYKVVVISQELPDSTNPTAPVKSYVDEKYSRPETTDLLVEVKSGGSCDLKVTAGTGTIAPPKDGGTPSNIMPMPR